MRSEDGNGKITLSPDQLADVALSTIRAVIGTNRYQYLSGPITGGRSLLEWHELEGRHLAAADYKAAREVAVVKPNISLVQDAAMDERANGRNTIEPGSFEADFEHWEQDDFLKFWDRVIEKHSESVRFMDGWEFSAGCTFEYLCARTHGRATYDMSGGALEPAEALALLEKALAEIEARYDPTDKRDEPIAKLHGKIRDCRDKIAALA